MSFFQINFFRDFADIFAKPLDPAEQLQKDMEDTSKQVQDQFNQGLQDFQNLFAAPTPGPTQLPLDQNVI